LDYLGEFSNPELVKQHLSLGQAKELEQNEAERLPGAIQSFLTDFESLDVRHCCGQAIRVVSSQRHHSGRSDADIVVFYPDEESVISVQASQGLKPLVRLYPRPERNTLQAK